MTRSARRILAILSVVSAAFPGNAGSSLGDSPLVEWPTLFELRLRHPRDLYNLEFSLVAFSKAPAKLQRAEMLEFVQEARWLNAHPNTDSYTYDVGELEYISVVKRQGLGLFYPANFMEDKLVPSTDGRGIAFAPYYLKYSGMGGVGLQILPGHVASATDFAKAECLIKSGYYDLPPNYWKRADKLVYSALRGLYILPSPSEFRYLSRMAKKQPPRKMPPTKGSWASPKCRSKNRVWRCLESFRVSNSLMAWLTNPKFDFFAEASFDLRSSTSSRYQRVSVPC